MSETRPSRRIVEPQAALVVLAIVAIGHLHSPERHPDDAATVAIGRARG